MRFYVDWKIISIFLLPSLLINERFIFCDQGVLGVLKISIPKNAFSKMIFIYVRKWLNINYKLLFLNFQFL